MEATLKIELGTKRNLAWFGALLFTTWLHYSFQSTAVEAVACAYYLAVIVLIFGLYGYLSQIVEKKATMLDGVRIHGLPALQKFGAVIVLADNKKVDFIVTVTTETNSLEGNTVKIITVRGEKAKDFFSEPLTIKFPTTTSEEAVTDFIAEFIRDRIAA